MALPGNSSNWSVPGVLWPSFHSYRSGIPSTSLSPGWLGRPLYSSWRSGMCLTSPSPQLCRHRLFSIFSSATTKISQLTTSISRCAFRSFRPGAVSGAQFSDLSGRLPCEAQHGLGSTFVENYTVLVRAQIGSCCSLKYGSPERRLVYDYVV